MDLLHTYPDYLSFVQPAFYPPGVQPSQTDSELKKAGLETWPIDSFRSDKRIYVIHSHEDSLLSADYNAQGIMLLKGKGLNPIVDLTSFNVSNKEFQRGIIHS